MERWTFQLAAVLLAGAAHLGCKRTHTPDAIAVAIESAPQASSSGQAVTARGSIRGKTVFGDQAPAPRPINNQACHNNQPKPIVEESIAVNPNGTLKNVVVYLKDVQGGDAPSPVGAPAIIDQVDCHYVPHVVAVTAGQGVIFKSSDPTLHNVHILGSHYNDNFAMPAPGLASPRKFADAEFTRVKCDVHPWMNCWIAVLDGPYFAVTDDKGEFEIKNVPVGTYTLNAWHERLEPQMAAVTVVADKAAEATLTYKAP